MAERSVRRKQMDALRIDRAWHWQINMQPGRGGFQSRNSCLAVSTNPSAAAWPRPSLCARTDQAGAPSRYTTTAWQAVVTKHITSAWSMLWKAHMPGTTEPMAGQG